MRPQTGSRPLALRPWVAVVSGIVVGVCLAAAVILTWPGLVRSGTDPGRARLRPDTTVALFRSTLPLHEIVVVRAGPDGSGEPALASALYPDDAAPRELASVLLLNRSPEDAWSVDLASRPIRGRFGEAAWEPLEAIDAGRAARLPPSMALRLRALSGAGSGVTIAPGTLRRVLLALPEGRRFEQVSGVQWGDRELAEERVDVESFHALRNPEIRTDERGAPREMTMSRDDEYHDDPVDGDRGADVGGEIVSADELARGGAAGGSLVTWLEQAHRDSAANRAQARELIRALEQVRDSQEYVGRALRDEQRRGKRLVAALVLAPLLAAGVIWGLWDRMDALRGDVDARVREIAEGQAELRRAQDDLQHSAEAEAQRVRADALEADLERLRDEVTERAEADAQEAARRTELELALRRRLGELEEESAAAQSLRAQLAALRSKSGAESARADALDAEIRRLERELGAARVAAPRVPPAAATAASDEGARGVPADTAEPPVAAATPPPPGPEIAGTTPAPLPTASAGANGADEKPAVDPNAGAVRRPEDLRRILDDLNALLSTTTDAVRYRVERLGGVRGETLLDVVVVAVDANDRVIRKLSAKTAKVRVVRSNSQTVVDLIDGHLSIAGREAPFFNGRYSVLVTADTDDWVASGLSFLTFE